MKNSEGYNVTKMSYKVLLSLILCIVLLSFSHIGKSQENSINITVKNIKEPKGNLLVSLYYNVTDFLKEGKEFRKQKVKVTDTIVHCSFKHLPKGSYGVAIYQDVNDDGKCNKNFLGIPKEGFGFSKNHRPILLPPSFNDVKLELDKDQSIIINLIYF